MRFVTMELLADPDIALLLYTTEPASDPEQAMTFVASWTAGRADAPAITPRSGAALPNRPQNARVPTAPLDTC